MGFEVAPCAGTLLPPCSVLVLSRLVHLTRWIIAKTQRRRVCRYRTACHDFLLLLHTECLSAQFLLKVCVYPLLILVKREANKLVPGNSLKHTHTQNTNTQTHTQVRGIRFDFGKSETLSLVRVVAKELSASRQSCFRKRTQGLGARRACGMVKEHHFHTLNVRLKPITQASTLAC